MPNKKLLFYYSIVPPNAKRCPKCQGNDNHTVFTDKIPPSTIPQLDCQITR